MDTATSDIRAVEFTPSRDGDSPVLPDLFDQIPQGEELGTVTADGAYDTRRCHSAIIARDAVPIIPIIPIRKNARAWKEDCPAAITRNETLRATRHYRRAFWKRWTGYHARRRIEANPLMVCRQTTAGQWLPQHAVSGHLARLRIERVRQRGRAVALVIVGHHAGGVFSTRRSCAPLLERQPGLRPIQRLDLRLLIMLKACLWHDTQNHSPIRWIKVETDEIRDLFLEQRVIRDLEPLREMRLQASFRPYAADARR